MNLAKGRQPRRCRHSFPYAEKGWYLGSDVFKVGYHQQLPAGRHEVACVAVANTDQLQHQCRLRKMILKNCFAENFAGAGNFVLSERRNIVTCFPGHLLYNTCSSSAVAFKSNPSCKDMHFRLASCFCWRYCSFESSN